MFPNTLQYDQLTRLDMRSAAKSVFHLPQSLGTNLWEVHQGKVAPPSESHNKSWQSCIHLLYGYTPLNYQLLGAVNVGWEKLQAPSSNMFLWDHPAENYIASNWPFQSRRA
ncbi:hypothetical protein SUGI_0994860 [Cryptomeria japonica]|nr:hypothetical protein SUGI_0994860 [Cryptomeria japonica]